MIDRPARNEALQALQRFLAGETTNDEYEDEYPLPKLFGRKESKDLAIKAIYGMSWTWFDDLQTHKLEGKWALEPEAIEIGNRCCEFLKTELEYEWKQSDFIGTNLVRSVLTTLRLIRSTPTLNEQIKIHLDQSEGDASVWPFFRKSDLVMSSMETESNGTD